MFDPLAKRKPDSTSATVPAYLPQMRVWTTDQRSPQWDDFLAAGRALGDPHQPRFSVEFSAVDVQDALWSLWGVTGYTGYPQPEDTYLDQTYTGRRCTVCNVGRHQIAPFRMIGEPRLGRRAIMQMLWVYDAWFVTPAAYESVFEPFGLAARPALTKGGRTLKSVVQLVIDEYVPLAEYRTAGETCSACGEFRLHAQLINYAPPPAAEPTGPLALSSSEYGSGGQSFRETLIRNDLVAAITQAGLKGARFHPCGDSPQQQQFELSAGVTSLFGPSGQ